MPPAPLRVRQEADPARVALLHQRHRPGSGKPNWPTLGEVSASSAKPTPTAALTLERAGADARWIFPVRSVGK